MTTLVWLVTLLVSNLTDMVWEQFLGPAPGWLFQAKVATLALVVAAGWAGAAPFHTLRTYFSLLLLLIVAWGVFSWVLGTPAWGRWTGAFPWAVGMTLVQAMKLGVALVTIAALRLVYARREAFFLTRGTLGRQAAPVPWIGMRKPTPWTVLGPMVAGIGATIMTGVLVASHRPSGATLVAALPLLPAALLHSVTNAFSEELSFRASLLAPLQAAVGRPQALALTAVFFGLAHYSGGVPLATLPTLLMTGFLGWLMAKAMVETEGLFWSWLIHLVNDIPVFAFLAIGSLAGR
jgi:membrane protease YdiL (CAAX protease family)